MNNNDDIQSRRQFFKKAVKGTLPILGALALLNVPFGLMAQEQTKKGGCNSSCSANCSYQCVVTCRTMCAYDCGGSCRGSCKISCMYTCKGPCGSSCGGTCMAGAKMRTDSISKDTTILKR